MLDPKDSKDAYLTGTRSEIYPKANLPIPPMPAVIPTPRAAIVGLIA